MPMNVKRSWFRPDGIKETYLQTMQIAFNASISQWWNFAVLSTHCTVVRSYERNK